MGKRIAPELMQILRHSLGLDRQKKPYRNHFCAGGRDVALCRELVVLGFMEEHEMSAEISGGDPVFHVTKAGEEEAKHG